MPVLMVVWELVVGTPPTLNRYGVFWNLRSACPTKVAAELPGPPTPHVVAHGALMRRQDTTQLEALQAAVSCLFNCIGDFFDVHIYIYKYTKYMVHI